MNVAIVSTTIQAVSNLFGEYIRHRTTAPITYPDNSSLERLLDSSDQKTAAVKMIVREEPVTQVQPEKVANRVIANPPETLRIPAHTVEQKAAPQETEKPNKATSIASGCIPCSLGHVGTCSGLMKEAVRFATGPDGVASPEVIDRVNMCLDELNTMERVDMSPEMIQDLPEWEKSLAHEVLAASRATRHELEDVSNFGRLEEIAARTAEKRKDIGRQWMTQKLAHLTPEDKTAIQQRIIDKLNEIQNTSAVQNEANEG